MRKAVHAAFSYPVLVNGVALSARWHTKQRLIGQLENGGYAEILENLESLVFMADELEEKSVLLEQGTEVVITHPAYSSATFYLDVLMPNDGPLEVKYQVARA